MYGALLVAVLVAVWYAVRYAVRLCVQESSGGWLVAWDFYACHAQCELMLICSSTP